MRFHVIGLPYVPISRNYPACAFTNRAWLFCSMMESLGHTVFAYSLQGSDAPCTKLINLGPRHEDLGPYDNYSVCYMTQPFEWQPTTLSWHLHNTKAVYWIRKNLEPNDYICVIGGACFTPLNNLLRTDPKCPRYQIVEYGVGYLGTFCARRVFDSYAHMHHVYGRESGNQPTGCDGQNFDAVIPCPVDLAQFDPTPGPTQSPLDQRTSTPITYQTEPYALFLGRMIDRKGVDIAVEATRRAGMRLLLAGQGATQSGTTIHASDNKTYTGAHLQYIGYVDQKTRNSLMQNAACLICPTKYLEPGGGVACEAQCCGTPVIAPDFGCFTESVLHGTTGFRCRTLEQYEWALRNVHTLNRTTIANHARTKYGTTRVSFQYQEYFNQLNTLWDQGFYQAFPSHMVTPRTAAWPLTQ